nr:MAG TPA: hypothetical protein [Bacteriophage sp.]
MREIIARKPSSALPVSCMLTLPRRQVPSRSPPRAFRTAQRPIARK